MGILIWYWEKWTVRINRLNRNLSLEPKFKKLGWLEAAFFWGPMHIHDLRIILIWGVVKLISSAKCKCRMLHGYAQYGWVTSKLPQIRVGTLLSDRCDSTEPLSWVLITNGFLSACLSIWFGTFSLI